MYEEGNKRLSLDWGSLLIKLGILAVVVFVVFWIFTLVTGKKNDTTTSLATSNSEYITNVNAMKDAAFEYFTSSKLPEKAGESKKITLEEMINQKLLIDFTEDGKTCDLNSSYIQATKTADENYALKVSLTCGKKSDFIVTTIEKKNVIINNITNNNVTNPDNNSSNTNNNGSSTNNSSNSNTTVNTKPTTTTTKVTIKIEGTCVINCGGSNNDNNNNNNDNVNTGKVRYYEQRKYSDWKDGYSNASNAINEQRVVGTADFCPVKTKTYYSSGYVTNNTSKGKYDYEVQLLDIDPDDVVRIKLVSKERFGSSTTDYRNYINQRYEKLYMTGNTGKYDVYTSNASTMRDSSLKSSNFNFTVGKIELDKYEDYYKTKITIDYKNHNGVTAFYGNSINQYVYFVPLKFTVEYALWDECIRDNINSWNYTNYYIENERSKTVWQHRTYETQWTKEQNVSGWEYTGNYKDVQ